MKRIVRLFTSKRWRGHKRRIFFESVLDKLQDQVGPFTGVKKNYDSFGLSCHELASSYNFYPTDKVCSMDVGSAFLRFHAQSYESLNVEIRRMSSVFHMFLKRNGIYTVSVVAVENGEKINFSYDVNFPSDK